jgi:uncharacterized damage-inducible protein DinB
MFRQVQDFVTDYTEESREARKNWDALTDASLAQTPGEGYWSIADHLWHISSLWDELFAGELKLWPESTKPENPPAAAAALAEYYSAEARRVCDWVAANWNDGDLLTEIELWGMKLSYGRLLYEMLKHEAHHRGQVVILMRLAQLPVHGIYGPSKEEAAAMDSQAAQQQ